ncbi:MAG: DHA2 family efflux MFS transporter permease subunit [Kineosporiaceae bacterium]
MSAATSTPPAPARPDDGLPSPARVWAIIVGLLAGILLAALDQTIVATSLRTIADDLQGLQLQAWATTAYLVTATVTTPLYGKLGDLYGRKNLYLVAITVFVVGSVLCTLSTSMYELAIYRAVQGLGAGGLFTLALAIIGDLVPPRERARYQGLFIAVFGTSSVLGPLVGGFLAGADSILGITGWRWVFLVNVPVGLVALALVWFTLRIPHVRRPHRLDVLGAMLLVTGVVPLLLVAEQGRNWGWGSPGVLTLLVLSVAALVSFVVVEHRAGDEALVPLRLFRSRTVAVGSVASLIVGTAMFGGLAVLPLYLQIVKGQTPTEAGLSLLPLTAGIMVAALVSGQVISRTGRYRAFPIAGSALMVVSLVLFAQVGADTPLWWSFLSMALFGIGLGCNMQPVVLAVQNAAPPSDIGVATSTVTFARQMGGTLGTAVFLSMLFSTAGDRIAGAFARAGEDPAFRAALADESVLANPANAEVARQVSQAAGGSGDAVTGSAVLDDSSFLSALDPRLAEPFRVGFSEAMDLVFWLAAAVMLVGFLVIAFLPELPLRSASPLSERVNGGNGASSGSVVTSTGAAAPTSTRGVAAAAGPSPDGRGAPAAPKGAVGD